MTMSKRVVSGLYVDQLMEENKHSQTQGHTEEHIEPHKCEGLILIQDPIFVTEGTKGAKTSTKTY